MNVRPWLRANKNHRRKLHQYVSDHRVQHQYVAIVQSEKCLQCFSTSLCCSGVCHVAPGESVWCLRDSSRYAQTSPLGDLRSIRLRVLMVAKTSVCPYSLLLFFVSDVRLRFVSSVVSLRRAYSCGVGDRCFILLIYFGVGHHGDADQQSENHRGATRH